MRDIRAVDSEGRPANDHLDFVINLCGDPPG
jgi:hypothetical protein